jgi:hypothetical protein
VLGLVAVLSTDNRHSYTYQLSPLFLRAKLHTGASEEKLKEASPII